MLKFNVADMSDLELAEHLKALTEEQEMRKRRDKENAWNNFRDELMNYLKKYGPIEVYDGSYQNCKLSTNTIVSSAEIGVIVLG